MDTKHGHDQAQLSFRPYDASRDLPQIIDLMQAELSEPYIIYTYRYFLTNWPQLCFLCISREQDKTEDGDGFREETVGAIVCKQEAHRGKLNRGYIAMLTTKKEFRKMGIARKLVQLAMDQMIEDGAKEVLLETEYDNSAALAFYEKLGFFREKRFHAFYLNYKDAFRLVYPILPPHQESEDLFT